MEHKTSAETATIQIVTAPFNAIFVCANYDVYCIKQLAKDLNRPDVVVKAISSVFGIADKWRGHLNIIIDNYLLNNHEDFTHSEIHSYNSYTRWIETKE
tara:strand:- start:1485 stop:1781 length:297 start_codon:yes stop_codon:yes gene_type:complete